MKPFFTIIIPTKNNEDLVDKGLKSLWELDYPRESMEIIVSDGLSADKTREIAESYGAKVVLDHNKSVVSGRNVAFAIAEGDFVAFPTP